MGRSRSRSGERRQRRREPSRSESGTPDWLRERRKKQDRGEITRGPQSDFGGGSKGSFGGGSKGGGKAGDWECPKGCGMVFASKSSCFKCGTPKPGGGGGDFGGGKGSRPGDWTCPGCNAMVFASILFEIQTLVAPETSDQICNHEH